MQVHKILHALPPGSNTLHSDYIPHQASVYILPRQGCQSGRDRYKKNGRGNGDKKPGISEESAMSQTTDVLSEHPTSGGACADTAVASIS